MNKARYRRQEIHKKARLATIKRLAEERNHHKEIDETPKSLPVNSTDRWARVYLRVDNTIEPWFTTSIAMQLPIDGTTQTIMNMQKKGFWAVRPNDNEALFVMPGQIRQVRMGPYDEYKGR